METKTHYQYYFRLFTNAVLIFVLSGTIIYAAQLSFDWVKSKFNPAVFHNVAYLLTGKKTPPPTAGNDVAVKDTGAIKFVSGAGKIKITGTRPAALGRPAEVDLSVSLAKNEAINLAGWRLRSARGIFYLPVAVEVFDPLNYSAPQNIVFKGSGRIKIYFAESRLGLSFRLNKCAGYLESLYRFNPALPKNCPVLAKEPGFSELSQSCRNYLNSLGICGYPSANPAIPSNDYSCREFLNNVNYEGCFARHKNDSDFLASEWRLFFSGITDFLVGRGTVELVDPAGQVISERGY
jgi:hypothetical protein